MKKFHSITHGVEDVALHTKIFNVQTPKLTNAFGTNCDLLRNNAESSDEHNAIHIAIDIANSICTISFPTATKLIAPLVSRYLETMDTEGARGIQITHSWTSTPI